jgi:hypothetical protein
MKDMTVEIWRTAYNFPDYEVSNFGKVRSKDRIIEHSNGRLHKTIGKILVQRLDHNGYLTVSLQKNKRNYKVKVHRLVLSTFSECIGEQVNHIDEDKTNNKLLNLEWCTAKYNANYGTRNARIQKRNEHRRKTGQDTTESTSDTTVSEADLTRHKS